MDMRKIRKLIELIQSTGVAEIEIREGEESVRITRETHSANTQPIVMMAPPQAGVPQQPVAREAATDHPSPATAADTSKHKEKHTVKAPMVGTVYLSSTPGSKPLVEIGQTVKIGDVICLIEAMKMFNQIEADKAGIITARLVENGMPVEFNQPLFVIEEQG